MKISRSMGLLMASTLLLGGCGTLPDAKPFAAATGSLATSVHTAGNVVADTLAEATDIAPKEQQSYTALSAGVREAWQVRTRAAQAAVVYADSISNLVSAGTEGGQTVGKVADALALLATQVNVPLVAPVADVVTDFAKLVFEKVAVIRASAKLEVAMEQAQPAVDALARMLQQDAQTRLRPMLVQLHKTTRSSIQSEYETEDNFRTELQKQKKAALQGLLKDLSTLAQVQAYDRADALVATRLQERDKKLEAAAAAHKARLQLVDALSSATTAWAQAHRDLAAAVRDKRQVNTAELQATITDLKALVKKVNDL